jgi:hypothetical protein
LLCVTHCRAHEMEQKRTVFPSPWYASTP